jgi:MscS family membrane protein
MITRKSVTVLAAVVVFVLWIVPSAFVDDAVSGRGQSTPASSPAGTPAPPPAEIALAGETPISNEIAQAETGEPEPTSLPEDDATAETVSTRTPVPTVTPGLISSAVDEFTAVTGLAKREFLGLSADDWINLAISALFVLGGYLLATWLVGSLLRRAAERSPTEFDDAILEAIGPQARWLIVVLSLRFATIRLTFLGSPVKSALQDLYFILFLGLGIWIGWHTINFVFDWYRHKVIAMEDAERLGPILTLLDRIALTVLVATGLIVLLSHFGVNVSALTASLGIAGLALSLAAQDTLSDAISGFVILMDQPFRVGDRIEISGLGTWGDVVQIGTRTTRIRTRDNRMVIVPNSTIGKSQVVNYTYPDPQYRVQMDIGIGYGMDIEQTRQLIVDTLQHVEGVLPSRPVDALYNEMGDSAMMFRVRWWIESYEDTRRIYDRVNTALQRALDEAGIEMPYPTHSLDLRVEPETADRLSQAFREPGQ